jgi:hypothetical protein
MRCVDGDRSWADLARELTLDLVSSLAFTEKKYGGGSEQLLRGRDYFSQLLLQLEVPLSFNCLLSDFLHPWNPSSITCLDCASTQL